MPDAQDASTIVDMTRRETEETACRLRAAVGSVEACPEERCAFWEPGGAVVSGRCIFEQVDLRARRELASWLLSIRTRLEAPSA